MKLFWIASGTQRYNTGVFYNLAGNGPRRPWPLYQDLACRKCMKMLHRNGLTQAAAWAVLLTPLSAVPCVRRDR